MNSKSNVASFRTKLAAAAALALIGCTGPAAAEDDAPTLREQAFQLYDQGRYVDARPLLERLEAQGQVDGVLLYRLYYCQRIADDPAARPTLDRARGLLEQELGQASDLEIPFYLANAYRNAGRLTDARRVAAQATERVASGDLPAPADGFEMFRMGKLYADQDREAEAEEWYAKALELLAADRSGAAGPYVEWAGRYLVERAWAAEDYDAAARYLGLVSASGRGSAADLDRLATASCRLGRYGEAKAAWRRAEQLDPAEANRPRYCWHLAEQAEEIGQLPRTAPDERPWADLSKEELEQLLLDQARVVGEVTTEAQETAKLKKKRRKQLQARLDAARPVFIGAALEYALRGHGIRETAFFGGYAPLIFHADRWKLPGP